MAGERISRILCAADPRGSGADVERLVGAADHHDAHAIALVGDLGGDPDPQTALRSVFRALGAAKRPTYWVPGPGDAPIAQYLREAHNIEVVFPMLRGLHGTAAVTPDSHVIVAGFGGEVDDDPDAERDEIGRLRYPRWEPEYRLKIIREFEELQVMMLFSTPPAHRAHGDSGSEALTELIATYRARMVVCGGERRTELIGRTMVVAPGGLTDGHYAMADLHTHHVDMHELTAAA